VQLDALGESIPRRNRVSATQNASAAVDPAGTHQVFELEGLAAALARVTDQRKRHGVRSLLVTMLGIIDLAKLAGEGQPPGITKWTQARLPAPQRSASPAPNC
jgi:hypothetical protein